MNKYSSILTFVLIVVIVLIVSILGYMGYDMYVKEKTESQAQLAMEEFEQATQTVKKPKPTNTVENNTTSATTNEIENTTTSTVDPSEILSQLGNNTSSDTGTTSNNQTTQQPEKTYLEGYEILGTINIPKTGAKYPVLSEVTKKSLETSVAVLYPQNLTALNLPGNTVIVGHNYRNGKFFSNNKKLEVGDIVEIKDATGTTVTYEIYNVYITTPNDADYMKRPLNEGEREISLSTCTDDSSGRIVIWAKEKK